MFARLIPILLLCLAAMPTHAAMKDVTFYMAPVEGVFSFMGGKLEVADTTEGNVPLARPDPAEAARFEAFLEQHLDTTLLFVRGNRVLRKVTPTDNLYDRDHLLPLVDSGFESDRDLASEAPDRIEVYAIGGYLPLDGEITGFEEILGDAGMPAAALDLSPAATAGFQRMSELHTGQQVATVLNRWLLSAPLIQAPMTSDRLVIDLASQQDPSTRTEILNILKSLVRPGG
jgi:hypothetical protein